MIFQTPAQYAANIKIGRKLSSKWLFLGQLLADMRLNTNPDMSGTQELLVDTWIWTGNEAFSLQAGLSSALVSPLPAQKPREKLQDIQAMVDELETLLHATECPMPMNIDNWCSSHIEQARHEAEVRAGTASLNDILRGGIAMLNDELKGMIQEGR